MVTYETEEVGQYGKTTSTDGRFWQLSALAAILGGLLVVGVGLALFTVLNEAEFVYADPLGAIGFLLILVGLPAFYLHERDWFGRVAKLTFAMVALGTIVTAVALPIAIYGPGIAFLGFVLGFLVTVVGAFGFGVARLRADVQPRLESWLFVAALPVGLPLAYGFTTYVMGETADPWAGPMVFFGLAWVVFGRQQLRRTRDVR
ncbi:hypothetical protein [Haloprofundus sp. MHR1]|uniref:hypothetical protein n=1 Tax=Haloprofundus sp. MHR1 TaxID=2572921 RepID=UPI0010BF2C79|nr:hypothetical protein [Haloprofundus sp. MHR1]QCJ45912.1 hypothetical protein FCF25_01715 [Haloprofundus sp. MHR1]